MLNTWEGPFSILVSFLLILCSVSIRISTICIYCRLKLLKTAVNLVLVREGSIDLVTPMVRNCICG